MPKDGQIDDKKKRVIKSNGQTPLTREAKNKQPNRKKQSVRGNDV